MLCRGWSSDWTIPSINVTLSFEARDKQILAAMSADKLTSMPHHFSCRQPEVRTGDGQDVFGRHVLQLGNS